MDGRKKTFVDDQRNSENTPGVTEDGALSQEAGEQLATVEPENITAEQLASLKDRAAKADEHWDRFLRVTAELENYRKRATRERQEAVKFAHESLLQRLIPVLDNFDMAMAAANAGEAVSASALQTGVAMIHQQLKSALVEAGLEEIDATNKTFDPNLHEAVSQRETADAPEGQVVQQLRKGYKLKERLLRPATVIVAAKPAAS
jgi:molecular chaperone GrpE